MNPNTNEEEIPWDEERIEKIDKDEYDERLDNTNPFITMNLHHSSRDLLENELPTVWTGVGEAVAFLSAVAVVVAIALTVLKIF